MMPAKFTDGATLNGTSGSSRAPAGHVDMVVSLVASNLAAR